MDRRTAFGECIFPSEETSFPLDCEWRGNACELLERFVGCEI